MPIVNECAHIEECSVVSVKNKFVYIKIVNSAKCGGCKACAFGRKNEQVLPAYSTIECAPGDTVRVEMPAKQIRFASVIMYLIPLAAFLIGLLSGIKLGEGYMLLFATIGLILSIGIIYFIDKMFLKNPNYLPKITEKIYLTENQNITEK